MRKLSGIEIFASIALGIAITLGVFLGGFAIGMRLLPTQIANTDSTPAIDDTGNQTADETTEPVDENALVIDWLPVAQQQEITSNTAISDVMYQAEFGNDFSTTELSKPRTFLLGTIKEGAYANDKLCLMIVTLPGMGDVHAHMYLLVPPNGDQPILLDQYSSYMGSAFSSPVSYEPLLENYPGMESLVQTNPSLVISEFKEPTEPVTDTNGNTYTYQGVWYRADYPSGFSPENTPHLVTLTTGETLTEYVFTEGESGEIFFGSGSYGFYTTREDGRLMWYDMDVPFWTDPFVTAPKEQAVPPSILWNDGTMNDNLYIKGAMGGCGITTYANVRELSDIGSLVEAGTYAVNGKTGKIYEVTSYDTEHYQTAFTSWQMGDETKTFEQFASGHPYFYWQDGLGRWIEFTNTDILPAAECGKPVIYLYPEEPTDVTVKIAASLSVSEPAYNDGWKVTAYPDGTLVTADGTAYPYLFWEGIGKLYMSPKNYWVVEKSEIKTFLTSTLGKLGLNQKETEDFMEFWYPKMQSAPYYKIGFHGTNAMNQIAPLTFSVHPDMMLRVLMDYEPLTQAIPANPPKLPPTPVRHGFSVIEWGGVLR